MSRYITLGKIPESPEERKKLISQRVEEEEYLLQVAANYIQKNVVEFLTSRKGYGFNDLEINKEFTVSLANTPFKVKADIIINLDGARFLLIKCAANSTDSWERYTIAFCRVVESSPIPFAAVTDGETLRMLDARSGEVVSEGLEALPSREEARGILSETVYGEFPPERCEKEKRILYAFEAIKCPTERTVSRESE